jgi:8-oxo-dGTP pyrophosphatase MutT (NUDIX family)
MVQRHHRATFGATYAFPGGMLSESDREVHAFCQGISADEANRRLGVDHDGLDFYSAAARELFEEMGVLLARDNRVAVDGDDREKIRARLFAGELTWSSLLQQRGLAADELHYISHWETPLFLQRRFSARFFLAVMPPGQHPRPDGKERVASRWMTAARTLKLAQEGELELAFPTARNLETLAGFTSLPDLHRWARERWRSGITKLRPVVIGDGNAKRFVIPGDPGYPESER